MERCPKCGWYHTDECMGESMVADHNPAIPRTRTPILIAAMRLLAQEIQSEDGVANAAIAEAGDRLSELEAQLTQAQQGIGEGVARPHDTPEGCPTYYDGCNCTVEALVHNIERAEKAEARVAELESRLSSLDCRYAGGGVAEVSGSHCPADIPCDRCMAERRVAELEEGISTAMQLIEGGFDSAAYEALEALNAHK